jgi:hypothetical protein
LAFAPEIGLREAFPDRPNVLFALIDNQPASTAGIAQEA